ncbi:hypothetical protein E2C01_003501 [Portunus trituberculatus]|uniref:Uncharacterized protein n=1 Tax=Portunus trituberculatus TaxID=210409 RepID=A0A5B7CMH1_PORTR|nr:hypothetical protein [Portunus trituberculatus]
MGGRARGGFQDRGVMAGWKGTHGKVPVFCCAGAWWRRCGRCVALSGGGRCQELAGTRLSLKRLSLCRHPDPPPAPSPPPPFHPASVPPNSSTSHPVEHRQETPPTSTCSSSSSSLTLFFLLLTISRLVSPLLSPITFIITVSLTLLFTIARRDKNVSRFRIV